MIVVDTNVVAYLLIPGERTPRARAALLKDPEWAAPILWRSEFRNVLALYMRRNRLSLADALSLAEEAEGLFEGREHSVESRDVLSLCSTSGCSGYDCEFAALAVRLGVPLVTADAELLQRIPSASISLDAFVQG
jgi:predicted nucleic acid-binding protein